MANGKQKQKRSQSQPQATPHTQAGGSGLPDAHRFAFLQVLMARGWMLDTEAKQLFAELDKLAGGGASYTGTIADINDALNFLLVAIRQIKYPVDGKRYLAFVNKDNDDIAKDNGSPYTIPQVQYLRAVIEAIAQDPEAEEGVGTISGIEAMNVTFCDDFTQASQGASQAARKGLTMNEKEAALSSFVDDGWLNTAPDVRGHYTLGVRTFVELHQQLLDFDIPDRTRRAWEEIL